MKENNGWPGQYTKQIVESRCNQGFSSDLKIFTGFLFNLKLNSIGCGELTSNSVKPEASVAELSHASCPYFSYPIPLTPYLIPHAPHTPSLLPMSMLMLWPMGQYWFWRQLYSQCRTNWLRVLQYSCTDKASHINILLLHILELLWIYRKVFDFQHT